MSQHLETAVVRVLNRSGETVGTGFFVDQKVIVTCAHLIDRAVGVPEGHAQPGDIVDIALPGTPDDRLAAQVLPEGFSPVDCDDVAFLSMNDHPKGTMTLKLGSSRNCKDHVFDALGFVRLDNVNQRWESGKFKGPVDTDKRKGELLQLINEKEDYILPGEPVLDKKTDRIAGMISCSESASAGDEPKKSTVVYATPAEYLKVSLQQVRDKHNPPWFQLKPSPQLSEPEEKKPAPVPPGPPPADVGAQPPAQTKTPPATWVKKGYSALTPFVILPLVGWLLVFPFFSVLNAISDLAVKLYAVIPSVEPRYWLVALVTLMVLMPAALRFLETPITKRGIFDMHAYHIGLITTAVVMVISLAALTFIQNCQPPTVAFRLDDNVKIDSGSTYSVSPQTEIVIRAYDMMSGEHTLDCTWHAIDPALQAVVSKDCVLLIKLPAYPTTTLISVETVVQLRSLNCKNNTLDYLIFRVQ